MTDNKKKIIVSAVFLVIAGVVFEFLWPLPLKNITLEKNEFFLFNSTGYKLVISNEVFNNPKTAFRLEEGSVLIQSGQNGSKKVAEFTKLAPSRIKDAIELMVTKGGKLPTECKIQKVSKNRWSIIPSEKAHSDCGSYAQPHDDSISRFFTILNDFVLAFIDFSRQNNAYVHIKESDLDIMIQNSQGTWVSVKNSLNQIIEK